MSQRNGFTLIELMIVLVVVGILIAIAYPSFVYFLIRTDRGDAREALAAVHLAQEQHRARNGSYTVDPSVLPRAAGAGAEWISPKGLYTIGLSEDEDISIRDGFVATATPTAGSRQMQDTACDEITLTVTPAGAIREPPECW